MHELKYISYLNRKVIYKDKNGNEVVTTNLELVKNKRIELNSIEVQIGAKRFWNWFYSVLVRTFPTRNYTVTIPVPEFVYTENMLDFFEKLNEILKKKSKSTHDDLIAELVDVEGLLNVKKKSEQIIDTMVTEISVDPYFGQVDLALGKINNTLDEINEELDKEEDDDSA